MSKFEVGQMVRLLVDKEPYYSGYAGNPKVSIPAGSVGIVASVDVPNVTGKEGTFTCVDFALEKLYQGDAKHKNNIWRVSLHDDEAAIEPDPAYVGKSNYGLYRSQFANKYARMDDEQLFRETKDMLWLSAFANSNPRSDYHWQVTMLYAEWSRRGKVDQYEKAFNEIKKESCG